MSDKTWHKFELKDFAIDKNGKPYLYATMISLKGLEPRKKALFFPSKVDGNYVYIHDNVITTLQGQNWTYDIDWPLEVLN